MLNSMGIRRLPATALVLLAVLNVAGCASLPGDDDARDPYDPFESLNRKVFAFNLAADRAILRPVARGYDAVVPRPVKSGVSNFFDNLSTPLWVLNHLLQGNVADAGRQGGRFLFNSTIGLLGLFDPADDAGLRKNSANFNQTLGKWGMPSGPYLMVPILGPNTPRSGLGWYARYHTDIVWNYLDDNRSLRDKLVALEIVDTRRQLLSFDRMLEQAPDPYIMLREAYRQRVEFEIRGEAGFEDDFDFNDFDDFED
jgi:phospholipid-binding lipoprotein MlaA